MFHLYLMDECCELWVAPLGTNKQLLLRHLRSCCSQSVDSFPKTSLPVDLKPSRTYIASLSSCNAPPAWKAVRSWKSLTRIPTSESRRLGRFRPTGFLTKPPRGGGFRMFCGKLVVAKLPPFEENIFHLSVEPREIPIGWLGYIGDGNPTQLYRDYNKPFFGS